MGKERMKMQENMNPAPEGAQTPADEEAAREAARLSQLKADMLVLIDTVADSSRDVKLIDGDTLFERFAKRASVRGRRARARSRSRHRRGPWPH